MLYNNFALANIFNCEIKDKDSYGNTVYAKLIIDVDDNSSTKLKIKNLGSQLYDDKDLTLAEDGYIGNLIVMSQVEFLSGDAYKLFVTHNSKKNGTMYFKAFFTENSTKGLIHSLTINVWEKNMPIYFFLSNKPEFVFKGYCK